MHKYLKPQVKQEKILVSNKHFYDLFLSHKIGGLVQDCSISSVLALEILQSCTNQSKYLQT